MRQNNKGGKLNPGTCSNQHFITTILKNKNDSEHFWQNKIYVGEQ